MKLLEKNKKAFTLLEVIIATIILSTMSIMAATIMTRQFKFLIDTKQLTIDSFESSQRIQSKILDYRDKIKLGDEPDIENSITLFESLGPDFKREAIYYKIIDEVDGRKYIYYISNKNPKELPVPVIKEVKMEARNNGTLISSIGPYFANTFSVFGSMELDEPIDQYLTDTKEWYFSKPGNNIPYDPNPSDDEMELSLYPKFPKDYEIIPSVKGSDSFNLIPQTFRGKHILYTVVPVSKLGKMGVVKYPKESFFISGLPIISNLNFHLDANYIFNEDITNTSGVRNIDVWKNRNSTPSINASVSSIKPILNYVVTGDSFYYGEKINHKSKSVSLKNNQNFTINGVSNESQFTLFVVAKRTGDGDYGLITKGTNITDFQWEIRSNKFILNTPGKIHEIEFENIKKDKYVLITIEVTSSQIIVSLNGNDLSPVAKVNSVSGTSTIVNIGKDLSGNFSDSEITELIMYKTNLGSSKDTVNKYLIQKYGLTD